MDILELIFELVPKLIEKFEVHRRNKKYQTGLFVAVWLVVFLISAFTTVLDGNSCYNVVANPSIILIPNIVAGLLTLLLLGKSVLAIASIVLSILVMIVTSLTPVFAPQAVRGLIGTVEEAEFTSEVDYIDLTQLPVIDTAYASKLADKKLGEIPSLGSQVDVGTLTLQSINDKLYYVAPLEYSGFFKWLCNSQGTAGYVKVSATNQNDVELVTEIDNQPLKLKYLSSAYFFDDLLFKVGRSDPGYNHSSYTFEVDNNGRPYYVASRIAPTLGLYGDKVIGTTIVDVQTGEVKNYDIDNIPEWVDRVQSRSLIKSYIDKWGTLVHGAFNFSNKDKLQTTQGTSIIYNNGECYYYTGLTSVGSDESLVGFILTDSRTGQAKMYRTSGATESAAVASAEGKVQQYKYTGTFPYLINVQGQPTYFTTLKDDNGLVKQYAMVNVKNYNVVAIGNSLQSTLNSYIESLSSVDQSLSSSFETKELTGIIDRIGLVIADGTSIYDFTLADDDKIYSVSTEVSRDSALTKIGDSVTIKYAGQATSDRIIVNSFKLNKQTSAN